MGGIASATSIRGGGVRGGGRSKGAGGAGFVYDDEDAIRIGRLLTYGSASESSSVNVEVESDEAIITASACPEGKIGSENGLFELETVGVGVGEIGVSGIGLRGSASSDSLEFKTVWLLLEKILCFGGWESRLT